MIIPINIINIIFNYSKPLTIDFLSHDRKTFYGVCINIRCYECIRFCPTCWKNFNVIYDMIIRLSKILPLSTFDMIQDKIIKYFIIRQIIRKINFRTFTNYENNYCNFLIQLHDYCEYIRPMEINNNLNYRKLYLLFYIMDNFL